MSRGRREGGRGYAPSVRASSAVLVALALAAVPESVAAQAVATVPVGAPRADDTTPANAADEEARIRFELGRRYYQEGRFDEAATEFERSYAASPRPEMLYNAYIAHRDAGNVRSARDTLRALLRTAYVTDTNRGSLEARLRRLDAEVAELDAADAPPAEPPPARADPESDEGSPRRTAAWALIGAGGAALAGSVVTGLLTRRERDALDQLCPQRDACTGAWEAHRDRGRRLAIGTDTLFAAGGALMLTGIVLAIARRPEGGSERARARADLACGPQGCTAVLRGRF